MQGEKGTWQPEKTLQVHSDWVQAPLARRHRRRAHRSAIALFRCARARCRLMAKWWHPEAMTSTFDSSTSTAARSSSPSSTRTDSFPATHHRSARSFIKTYRSACMRQIRGAAWAPDGNSVAVSTVDGAIFVVSQESGRWTHKQVYKQKRVRCLIATLRPFHF